MSPLSRSSFIAGFMAILCCSKDAMGEISQKTVDKRNQSEIGEFAIGLASKASDKEYDHAFVIWYFSDEKGQRTVRRCAGFYPVSNSDTKIYDVVFGITGQVFDDSKVKINQEITVLVNKDTFDKALLVEGQYQTGHTYHLAIDDCTTFVEKVASLIPGLKIPSRVLHVYPSAFITALYEGN